MCPPHRDRWDSVHGVAKGFLSVALHDRLLDTLVADDCTFDHVIYQWLGDPSLHPALEQLLTAASRRLAGRVGYLRVDTNGVLFGEPRIDHLTGERDPAVPLLVVFTLDAVTPGTYLRVKGREGLSRARRHVRHLLARRRGGEGLHVQVQFVVQEGNAHEAGEFLRYWRDAWACHGRDGGFFEVLFKPLSVDGGAPGQDRADHLYTRTLEQAGLFPEERDGFAVRVWQDTPWQPPAARTACPGLWFTPVIRHDGRLQMCCADLQGTLDLGSLADTSFRRLWEGPRALAHRMAHLAGRFEGACASCAGVNWYQLRPEHIAATREAAGRLSG